jgi:hypothetical protein
MILSGLFLVGRSRGSIILSSPKHPTVAIRKISGFRRMFNAFYSPILFFKEFLSRRFSPLELKFLRKLSFASWGGFTTDNS